MPTVEIKSHSVCAGGNHHTLIVSVDGGKDQSLHCETSEINAFKADEVRELRDAVLPLLRAECVKADVKNPADIKAALEGKTLEIAEPVKVDGEVIDVKALVAEVKR